MAVPVTCRRGMEKFFTEFQLVGQLAERSVVVILGPSTMPPAAAAPVAASAPDQQKRVQVRAHEHSSPPLCCCCPCPSGGTGPNRRLGLMLTASATSRPSDSGDFGTLTLNPFLTQMRPAALASLAQGLPWRTGSGGSGSHKATRAQVEKGTGGTLAPIFLSVLRCSGCGGGGDGRSTMLVGAPPLVTFRLSILAPVTSPHTAGTSALSSFSYAGKWSTRARAHPAIARL